MIHSLTPVESKESRKVIDDSEENTEQFLQCFNPLPKNKNFEHGPNENILRSFINTSIDNKHSESIAWQYQVPYRLHVFLEV